MQANREEADTDAMKELQLKQMLWVLLSILFRSASAVAAKQAGLVSKGSDFYTILWNHWYILSLCALFGQAICWILALRKLHLSFAYPFMSLVLLIDLGSARLLFDEPVHPLQVIGIAVIVTGVALIASSEQGPAPTRG